MSCTWFDSVTLTIEVAFTTDPLAATPTWTDVSDYVRAFTTDRGRRTEFETYAPGTCQITFDNDDRRFDPEHATGPYFGNLDPMKKVRISVAEGAFSGPIYTGFVLGWPQAYTDLDSTVTITCVDASRFLENSELSPSAFAHEVLQDSPFVYWPMTGSEAIHDDLVSEVELPRVATFTDTALVDVGAPVGDSQLLDGWVVNSSDTALTSSARTLEFWANLTDPGDLPLGRFPGCTVYGHTGTFGIPGDGVLFSVLFNNSDGDGPEVFLGYKNTADSANWGLTTPAFSPDVAPGLWHVVATGDATNLYVYINGTLTHTQTLGGSSPTFGTSVSVSSFAEGSSVGHVAFYTSTFTQAQVSDHYMAGLQAYGHPTSDRSGARIGRILDDIDWPSGQRDIATGDTHLGPWRPARATALAGLRSVEAAEQGAVFAAADGDVTFRDRQHVWTAAVSGETYSDDGSDNQYESLTIDGNSVDMIRNRAVATGTDVTKTRADATSVTAYGPVTQTVDATAIASETLLTELANYVVRLGKDPQVRIPQLQVNLRAGGYEELFGLELADTIIVERTPQATGAQIVKTLTVQGISHRVTGDRWDAVLYLSPAPEDNETAPYLTIGDLTYGKIGATAGNLIPF